MLVPVGTRAGQRKPRCPASHPRRRTKVQPPQRRRRYHRRGQLVAGTELYCDQLRHGARQRVQCGTPWRSVPRRGIQRTRQNRHGKSRWRLRREQHRGRRGYRRRSNLGRPIHRAFSHRTNRNPGPAPRHLQRRRSLRIRGQRIGSLMVSGQKVTQQTGAGNDAIKLPQTTSAYWNSSSKRKSGAHSSFETSPRFQISRLNTIPKPPPHPPYCPQTHHRFASKTAPRSPFQRTPRPVGCESCWNRWKPTNE